MKDLVLELPNCGVKVFMAVITEEDNQYYTYSAMWNDNIINCPDWGGHCRDFQPIFDWMKKTDEDMIIRNWVWFPSLLNY